MPCVRYCLRFLTLHVVLCCSESQGFIKTRFRIYRGMRGGILTTEPDCLFVYPTMNYVCPKTLFRRGDA